MADYTRKGLERIQQEIENLQTQLTMGSKKEAEVTRELVSVRQTMSRSSDTDDIHSNQLEMERLSDKLTALREKRALLDMQIAEKTRKLHEYQQKMSREQGKDRRRLQRTLKQHNDLIRTNEQKLLDNLYGMFHNATEKKEELSKKKNKYDAFISHASEDKEQIVRPLAEGLIKAGFSIWYDELQLKIGDRLRRSLDQGLANSRFGIVVLSPAFFAKNWPEYELDGLIAREVDSRKIILPLWHKVSKDEILTYSPTLADKIALSTTSNTIEELVSKLSEVLQE